MSKKPSVHKEPVFVFGASGHAKVVIDIIERQGTHRIAFLVDDNPCLKGSEFYGYRVIGGKGELMDQRDNSGCSAGIVAIGDNRARSRVAAWLVENGFRLVSAIHPSAQVGRGATVSTGTVIMAGAVINSDVMIGSNVIINSRASIDHDCNVGHGAHIAPGTTLCGGVRVGERSFIGAGSCVIPNITIGGDVMVGAGATVVRDVPDSITVTGTPARQITKITT